MHDLDITKEIRQHNKLTSARYEMSACEMDILFFLLSVLKKDDNKRVYILSAKEIEGKTGRQWNYQQFKKATENLGSRMYEVQEEGEYTQIWILSKAKYRQGMGCIELSISEEIKPYLLDLKDNFTSYKLQSVFSLKSKYSKRIYQIANQWKRIGEKKYTINELKVMLKLKDPKGEMPEKIKSFALFRAKVLEIAKQQINENTEIQIDYELEKVGRSFHYVTFHINTQSPKSKPIDFNASDEGITLYKRLVNDFEISEKLAIEVIENIDHKKVNKLLFEWKNQKSDGIIKGGLSPYIAKSLRNMLGYP